MWPRAPRRGSRAGRGRHALMHAWPRPGVWRIPTPLLHARALLAHRRLHVKAGFRARRAQEQDRTVDPRAPRPRHAKIRGPRARHAPIGRSRAYRVADAGQVSEMALKIWDGTLASLSSVPHVQTVGDQKMRAIDRILGGNFRTGGRSHLLLPATCTFFFFDPSGFWTAHRRRIVRSEQKLARGRQGVNS